MGIFDSLKNVLGGKKESEPEITVAPSQVLREAGIDPSGLKLGFGGDGTITVTGTVADEDERMRVNEILAGINGVSAVEDHMRIAPAKVEPMEIPQAEPRTIPDVEVGSVEAPGGSEEVEGGAPADEDAGGTTYTVVSGDTLWKISEAHYGNGSKYMKIFEANRDLLDDPNKIFPGQELKIPNLDD